MSDIVERLQYAIHDPETGEPLDTEGQGGMSNASIADVEDAIIEIKTLRAQLAAAVPEGHVVVPRVATEEMIVAGTEEWLCVRAMEDRAEVIWAAMVEAGSKRDE